MKLSSRKKLLEESDKELNRIRLTILFEQSGGLKKNLNAIAQKISEIDVQKKKNELESDLEKLRISMETQQKKFELDKKNNPDLTIENWYSKQSRWDRAIIAWERYSEKIYTGSFWQKIPIGLNYLASFLGSEVAFHDKHGNLFDTATGKKISEEDFVKGVISPTKFTILRNLIQSLSI